jgi:hypothetical protein
MPAVCCECSPFCVSFSEGLGGGLPLDFYYNTDLVHLSGVHESRFFFSYGRYLEKWEWCGRMHCHVLYPGWLLFYWSRSVTDSVALFCFLTICIASLLLHLLNGKMSGKCNLVVRFRKQLIRDWGWTTTGMPLATGTYKKMHLATYV